MSATLGVNLRVTCHGSRGDRKYMEDFFVLNYEPSEDEHKLEYAFFGIFDGHGGKEAALFAKEHLMNFIVSDKRFWSYDDDEVLEAITSGYLQTHYAMWQDQVNWPKTSSGLPSTSGTTASIAFIRRGKMYIGHVGDSSIVLGYQNEGQSMWYGKALTKDHKPEDAYEVARIESSGGKVVSKSGVPRVVWNRPRLGHKGPVRRSTPIDEIPFLAVARSLGDLWSYNSDKDEFVVSPRPDVHVIEIDVAKHRCLIFGTDGLWNMLNPQDGVSTVQSAEEHNEKNVYFSGQPATAKNQMWVNPSKSLVDRALRRWANFGARADNTSAVTLLLDPPGVQRRACERLSVPHQQVQTDVEKHLLPGEVKELHQSISVEKLPVTDHGVAIFTRHSTAEPELVPLMSLTPIRSETPKHNTSCSPEMDGTSIINQVDLAVPSADGDIRPPAGQLSSPQSLGCLKPCPSSGTVSPASDSTSRHDLSKGQTIKGTSSFEKESPGRNLSSNLREQHSLREQPPSLKSLTLQHNSQNCASQSKVENMFHKEEKNCIVTSDKSQELQRFQESVHHLTDSLQRQSHKRVRGKALNIDSTHSSSHNAFSLMKTNDSGIVRRRHSSVLDSRSSALVGGFIGQSLGYPSPYGVGAGYQPGAKRRTRSEDKLLQAVGRLEDDLRTSDEENERINWPVSWVNRLRPSDEGSEENNLHSCSTRRKKKWIRCSGNAIGRVKQARPSVSNRMNSTYSSGSGCDLAISRDCSEHNSSRVLRSDTHAGMPVHTLRSQNVDLKASRLSIHAPAKFTPKRSVQLKAALEMTSFAAGSSSLLPATKLLSTPSGLAKRHRQTFCSRTRSVTTRSRVKRLSK